MPRSLFLTVALLGAEAGTDVKSAGSAWTAPPLVTPAQGHESKGTLRSGQPVAPDAWLIGKLLTTDRITLFRTDPTALSVLGDAHTAKMKAYMYDNLPVSTGKETRATYKPR